VGTIVEQKLVRTIEVPLQTHALESGYCLNGGGAESHSLIGAAREVIPLRLPYVASVPLPKPQSNEQRA
jgi:hypothetical protein